jgi:hypothetical protein
MLNRISDNWRPLLSIADSLGRGDLARAAMRDMVKQHQDADAKIQLLIDIRTLFDLQVVDRFPSGAMLEALLAMDDSDWCEFHGARGDEAPHKLRASEMTSMLGAFCIRTRSLWPPGKRTETSKSSKGYLRSPVRSHLEDVLRHAGTRVTSQKYQELATCRRRHSVTGLFKSGLARAAPRPPTLVHDDNNRRT